MKTLYFTFFTVLFLVIQVLVISANPLSGLTPEENKTTKNIAGNTNPTSYCTPYTIGSNYMFINRVQLNTINNISGSEEYSDFTSISTELMENQTYTVVITPGLNIPYLIQEYAIWIDYNGDGDFYGPGELVWSKHRYSHSNITPIAGSFTVPYSTAQTSVRMRISLTPFLSSNPCGVFSNGEVEDYTINLVPELEEIGAYYFETGWDGWTDGGSDCARVTSSTNSYEGTYSIRIRDNSVSSNAVSPTLDLTGNTLVTFEFHSYAISMENGEDFFVEFYDGSTYEVIGHYVRGIDFNNGSFFSPPRIDLYAASYNFNTNNKFRIRCDASSNNDKIFFDEVIIKGNNVNPPPAALSMAVNNEAQDIANESTNQSLTKSSNAEINLYPNPTSAILNLEIVDNDFENITVISSSGQVVFKSEAQFEKLSIDVSQYTSGIYFVNFISKGETVTKRFIKN
ncbi:MAG: T9SS C-terminal target domain-containing protein [Bacteroidetes bacterium]|nr:MAG: T9SS C-terminal target domain-containing protein [Bacteroidota bacterium]